MPGPHEVFYESQLPPPSPTFPDQYICKWWGGGGRSQTVDSVIRGDEGQLPFLLPKHSSWSCNVFCKAVGASRCPPVPRLGESVVRLHGSDAPTSTGQKQPSPSVLARDADTHKMQISAFLREGPRKHTASWLSGENIVEAVWLGVRATLIHFLNLQQDSHFPET